MKNRTPLEIDWHALNVLCLSCDQPCKQCAAVDVVGCKFFHRDKVNKPVKAIDNHAQLW